MASSRAPQKLPRSVLVTGATSGIGLAAATRFADAGCRVLVLGRRVEQLASLREEHGDRVVPLKLDLTDLPATQTLAVELADQYPDLDALVNNAGVASRQPFQESSLDELLTVLDTNVISVVTLVRILLPTIIDRQGVIANVGSTAAAYPHGGNIVYGAGKAFLSHFSTGLRCDLRGTGVRVVSIEPGHTHTGMAADREYRRLDAADVADAIFYAVTAPSHVNLNRIELMPTTQVPGGYAIDRNLGLEARQPDDDSRR